MSNVKGRVTSNGDRPAVVPPMIWVALDLERSHQSKARIFS